MIKGSSVRKPDHAIDSQFADRWSPRAMSGEAIEKDELMVLFEAARWAPSSFNLQPWRMLYALRDSPTWSVFFNLLVDKNQAWAANAGALVLVVSKKVNDRTGGPARTHSFDTGAAWGSFALQGYLRGYAVHGMQGFDYDRARKDLGVPEEFQVEAMIAVGRRASSESLPPPLRQMEAPNDRRPLGETVCEGSWTLKA
jgi:nitroreductase